MLRLLPALVLLLAAPSWAQTGVRLFSTLDARAAEVGETVELTVEALATAPTAQSRDALRAAFARLDVDVQVRPALRVADAGGVEVRMFGDVVQVRRRVSLEVVDPAVREVPALAVAAWRTRAQPLRAYASGAAARAAGRSVVAVTAVGAVDGVPFERVGSAFLVGDDALVTAYHVVVGAGRVRVRLPDGREVATDAALALDPARDVAVLHLDGARRAGLRPLVLAPADAPGEVAFTAGWPGRRQAPTAARRFPDLVVPDGRVRLSANAVRPGDSGGPLLDEAGRVLGVVTSGRSLDGDPDLLAASVCLAADARPALARAGRAVPLGRALAGVAGSAARVHAAIGALAVLPDGRPHLADLLDAVRRAPGDPALQYLAGTVLDEGGADAGAADALRAAADAGFTPAAYSLAHLDAGAGRLAEAEAAFAGLDGPYAALGAFGRAQALVAQGRFGEAAAPLDAVLDHDPTFAPALYLLGLVRIAQGREGEAAALAVRLSPRAEWAEALRLPLLHPALRPVALEPLPRVPAWQRARREVAAR